MKYRSISLGPLAHSGMERIIKKIDDGFNRFTTVMQEDLDRCQIGGGNLSMEFLQVRILQPIQDKMDSMETFTLVWMNVSKESILS